ncbi:hypothetical protein quinque_012650 [Culex quinquefasciatus]
MKFPVTLGLFVAVVTADMELTPDERNCQMRQRASDKDVEMFHTMQRPVERTTKCYYDCMMQVMGYSNGKRFIRDRFEDIYLSAAKNDDQRRTIRHLADKCDGTEHDDACELAADIVACIRR